MKVLLTGATGQLGRSIQNRVPDDWQLISLSSEDLDITDSDKVSQIFEDHSPLVVINAAAFTAVDKAESEETRAREINAIAVKKMAGKCKEIGAFFIHISTDYVFDGLSSIPYKENDPINPLNIYGKTKAEGETYVARSGARYAIIRTSWVFSEYGNNFLKSMLGLAKNRDSLKVVSDQVGSPTYAGNIAETIISIIRIRDKIEGEIYHYTGDQLSSWADFARIIFDFAYAEGKIDHLPTIKGITTEQFGAAAARPKNSVLDCRKIKELPDIKLSDWQDATQKIISDYNDD